MGWIITHCRRVFEWLDVLFMPFGGWPVIAGICAAIGAFVWGLVVNWGPATIPAVIAALGTGAVAIDAIVPIVKKWRLRWSQKKRTALAIYAAYLEGQRILSRLRTPVELSLDDAWNRVKEWNNQVNEAVREAPAHETAGLWTINMPSHARVSLPGLEIFVRAKNEGKLRRVMLRAIENTKFRGSEIFGDALPPGNDHTEGADYNLETALADLMVLRTKTAQLRIKAENATNENVINDLTLKQLTLRSDIQRTIRLGISHAEAEAFETIGNLRYDYPSAINDQHRLLVCIAVRDLDYLDDLKARCFSYLGGDANEKA